YRLLIFKDRFRIHHQTGTALQLPRHRFVLRRCISSRETRLWRTTDTSSTPFCEFSFDLALIDARTCFPYI
ncbi:hypothetical protein, partial [Paraburkholderia sp. BL18I3N2]|uniref:hypothetical protein n=1 Tax=Paraburkholderia sp. BL18I3N2 TaxID=1938799 RepID=UPI001C6370F0